MKKKKPCHSRSRTQSWEQGLQDDGADLTLNLKNKLTKPDMVVLRRPNNLQ